MNWLKLGINLIKTPRYDPFRLVSDNKSVHGFNLSFLFTRTDIFTNSVEVMTKWIEENKIKVAKVNLFKIWDVAKAH